MGIEDMHIWFRQYAQQMGMQSVSAILPEQIDIVINTSIIDTVNQTVQESLGFRNDRVIKNSSKISQINALRTLYKVKIFTLVGTGTLAFTYNSEDYFNGKYSLNAAFTDMPDVMYFNDFSLSYTKCTSGWVSTTAPVKATTDGFNSNFYPVRLIEDSYLADTLNDFQLRPRQRSPIIIIYGNTAKETFDMYIDKFDKTSGLLPNSLAPYQFRMSYVAKPATVLYSEDLNGTNVDCDLPDFMHIDILKHAVDLYRVSVNNDLYSNQQQQKAQQQEDYKNQ